ncbi:hypothetical protein AGOR_G00198420 [Albula goreensis]|uniref:SH3 domain-containing protein n=1 Tax=Albula goreensis TaxID=1534307 RepID=A0A8T3CNJ0_9TELE|nr:hypothetical protein AGOR_G00198420 [Albula goreensis]
MGGLKQMRALVAHPASSNPTLLPFSQDEVITVMVQEPRNGWLYGRAESSLRQGWFPAAYVGPLEDNTKPHVSRGPSTNNQLEQAELLDRLNKIEGRGYNEIPHPAAPSRRGSVDFRPVTPTLERRMESSSNEKPANVHYGFRQDQQDRKEQSENKSYSEIPPRATPSRRGSTDLRPVTPTPERRMDSSADSKYHGYKITQMDQQERQDQESKRYSEIQPPAPPSRRGSADLRPVTPTPERRADSSTDSKRTLQQDSRPELFPRGTNPFATVKLRPTVTNDRSAPRIH